MSYGCYTLTDEAITAIAANCPALTALHVLHCKNLTAESIKAIAANCTSLAFLDLQGCGSRITDEAIRAVTANCQSLNFLDVSGCNITNELISVIRADCRRLTIFFHYPAIDNENYKEPESDEDSDEDYFF